MMNDERPDGAEETPRRMSKEETRDYHGLTLSEDGREETQQEEIPRSVHFHVFTTASMPWWKKAIYLGVAAALIAAFLVVAWFFLLGGLVIAAAVAVVYFLRKYILK